MIKKIGIPGYKSETTFGVGLYNLEYVASFGDPVILMPWEEYHKDLDMIYLPGGMDVNPKSYDEVPGFLTSNQDVFKQFFFEKRLWQYIEMGVPIFGVCLGMQMLNVHFGGKLVQNSFRHPNSADRWEIAHKVINLESGAIFDVNGHHHQLVTMNTLSKNLRAICLSETKEPVTVEALRHPTLPIVGVQWHPEEFYDDFCTDEINKLLHL
jgi:putative glutamine amidotransferase